MFRQMLVGSAATAALLASGCAAGTSRDGAAIAPAPVVPASAPADVEASNQAGRAERLVILHNNDLHFSFLHFDRFLEAVEAVRAREPDVLLLSGGDIVVRHTHAWPGSAGLAYYERRGRHMMELMNRARYDAAVPGNHELFAHGEVTRAIMEVAEFPWLAANIVDEDGSAGLTVPWHSLVTPGGLRVFILGLSVINFDPPPGLAERDLFEVVREHLPLAAQHDVFVLLTHRGIRDDIDLANEFPEIDVIVGGHTHSLLTDGLTVNGVLIVQTGSLGHLPVDEGGVQLGMAVLELDGDRPRVGCARVYVIDAGGLRPAGSRRGGSRPADPGPELRCAA